MKTNTLFFLILLFSGLTPVAAQELEELKEFFTFYPNRKAVAQDSTLYLSKLVAAPVISYAPETSLGFGVGAKYLFKFRGSGEETRTSNMPATLQYTLNNQFILYSGFEVFTNQEEWVIEGNLLFQNYPRLFYGIGRDTPKEAEEQYNYYQALVEPIFLKKMFLRYLFVGAGVRYNHVFNVSLDEGGTLVEDRPLGFEGSTSAGAEFAVLYDSRNNILNAQSGWYFEFTHGFYGKVLGGTSNFQLTRFDLRHYYSLSEKNDDVLAFQLVGRFSHGDVPFSELALFGGDDILRGYQEGRYVERSILAGQLEYRKTFKNSRLGMVAFVGGGDVFRQLDDVQLKNIRPNFGVGLRYMLDRTEKLNIRVDWGFGTDTNNLYLDIAEAF
ncbi:BamA/TamA family outer membrane protein [Croceiramulus getboli]|nr:BamA/TamA family outer membrane protein [Flavobacteriaceae bacterium YJPT1-3]